MGARRRIAVIGLDSATPGLVFDRFRDDMPHLRGLMERGAWGELRSTHPPITVPAWTSMVSSRDPGELGLYGFRNRKNHSYDGYAFASSNLVKVPRLWDILGSAGWRSIVLGVPQSYPPQPLNGLMVSCFLTPSTRSQYTYPPELKAEVETVAQGYLLDVEGFRTADKAALLDRLYEKTRKHFAVARHLVRTQTWDFFMMVEMGVDRLHHGFWSYGDPTHRKYEPGNPFANTMREYYRHVDAEVGELLDLLPDGTAILVVSDHGAKKMDGGICLNQWLMEQGYLRLAAKPSGPTPIAKAQMDWRHTVAWGDGGYYGRLFLNVHGREPQGRLDPGDYERTRDELIAAIADIPDDTGRPLGSRAYRPEELYRATRGVPPDLIVYFGDLSWRSVGTIGMPATHTTENDTGPDEANHDWNGILIVGAKGEELPRRGYLGEVPIYDVTPTVLDLAGLSPLPALVGRSLFQGTPNPTR